MGSADEGLRMIYVMGGEGFVGSAILRALRADGRTCIALTRRNYEEHRGGKCEVFINANGNSSKVLASRDPGFDFDASVRTTRRALLDFEAERFVQLSSCDVYPDCSGPESTDECTPIDHSLQSPYGFHKSLAEACVRHGARRWLILRMGGFVGSGLRKNAIYDVLEGGRLFLDPESRLQFLDVDAAAAMVVRLSDMGHWNQVINLVGRGVVCLRDVIEWSERSPTVESGSPIVRYDVSVRKLSRLMDVPESAQSVKRFIEERKTRLGGSDAHH